MPLDSAPSDIRLDREAVRRFGLYEFVKLAWHCVESSPFLDNWHIELICKHLEAVTRGEILRLVINIPPGCMKSLLVSVFWPVWEWIEHPERSWMYASFDASLSRRDAIKAQDIIGSRWFQERWPELSIGFGNRATSATEYYTNAGGLRFSTSVAGKSTGWHCDRQVVDDPTKPKDTKGGAEATGVKLKEARDWWTGTMASRQKNPKSFSRVVVMQRLHEDDLAGLCIDSGEYVVLRLPMEFEADTRCETKWGRDPRTVEGELLWPERYNADKVKELQDPIKGLGAADYAAQYQQRPMPKGGGLFRKDHFKRRYRTVPEDCQWMQSWDMRFKESSVSGDMVVGGVWAYKNAHFYLVKVYRGRWSFTQTIDAMKLAITEFPQATLKLVEDKANGPAVVNMLRDEITGLVLVDPEGGKEARANAVSPLFEAGNVWLPEDELMEPWVDGYIAELCAFPRGRFDDQVDMTSQALIRLKASALSRFLAAMAAAKDMAGGK